MQKVVNHLVQLQELVLVREQEAFMGGDRLKVLDESIASLTEQLPDDVKLAFRNLVKKDSVAVAPVSNGVCSTCGMKLPISLVQAIRASQRINHCPNCSRILYITASSPRSVAQRQSRIAPPKIGIEKFSSPKLMLPRMAAQTQEEAISELAKKMETEGFVEHSDVLVEAALRREAIISTAVDQGLAFPHVRGVEGGGLAFAMGMSPKGIKFTAQDKKLTYIIFFVVIPTAANAFYLKLLAGLAETLMSSDAQKELLGEEDPDKVWKILKKLTKKTIA